MNEEIQRCIRRLRIEYPDKCWTDFLPAILKHLRNMINSSTHHSAYELENLRAPFQQNTLENEVATTLHEFHHPSTIDKSFVQAYIAQNQRRQQALVNDIQTRDKRLVTSNKNNMPLHARICCVIHSRWELAQCASLIFSRQTCSSFFFWKYY